MPDPESTSKPPSANEGTPGMPAVPDPPPGSTAADSSAPKTHPDTTTTPPSTTTAEPTTNQRPSIDSPPTKKPQDSQTAENRPATEQTENASEDESTAPSPPALELPLQEAPIEYWESLEEQQRIQCYKMIGIYFHNLLEDFRNSANEAVTSYVRFSLLGKRWRLWLITLTGGLAILNVLATAWNDDWSKAKPYFSFAAAIYAVILALLTNIESFFNFSDKKTSTRESRELYLDAYREFEMLRLTHVYPYGYSSQGCFNFNELYRRLVAKDLELRRKIMQLSTTRPGTAQT